MKKILVAVDGSEDSKKALLNSANIAKRFDSEVLLVRVQKLADILFSEPEMDELKKSVEKSPLKGELEKKSRQILDDAEKILAKNSVTKIKKIFRWGHPAEEILKAADEEKVDAIVLGSHGRHRGILIGSVSREVMERAKVSVMIGR